MARAYCCAVLSWTGLCLANIVFAFIEFLNKTNWYFPSWYVAIWTSNKFTFIPNKAVCICCQKNVWLSIIQKLLLGQKKVLTSDETCQNYWKKIPTQWSSKQFTFVAKISESYKIISFIQFYQSLFQNKVYQMLD